VNMRISGPARRTINYQRQAIQLGLRPRLHITQTSPEGYGRIYVDFVNWGLMALTLGLTLTFRSSDNLAAAFGIAASLTMLLTMILIFDHARSVGMEPPDY
jgi:KUP system potassium uptake protein